MRQQYGETRPDGFEIVSVSILNDPNALRTKLQALNVSFPALYDGKKLAAKYGVPSVPGLVLLDSNGSVVYGSDKLDLAALDAAVTKCVGRGNS